MVGFNRHTPLDGEEKTLGDLIPTLKPPALKPPELRERSDDRRRRRRFSALSHELGCVLGALRMLAAGERYLPTDMVVRRGAPAGNIILTTCEHDVLSGLQSGFSNKKIADNLSLSEVTVKHHIKSLCGKLG